MGSHLKCFIDELHSTLQDCDFHDAPQLPVTAPGGRFIRLCLHQLPALTLTYSFYIQR